jgi:hypothetical protein
LCYLTIIRNATIGNDYAICMAEKLKVDQEVTKKMDLRNCHITDKGLKPLISSLSTSLEVLDLSWNPLISNSMMHDLFANLQREFPK